VTNLRGSLAALLGVGPHAVHVIYEEAAGSYGHNGADDVSADAALISQAVGKPVRVQWTRQDEHGWEPLGPAQAHDMKGAIDANGVTAWRHRLYTAPHSSRPSATNPGSLLAGALTGKLPDPLPTAADDASGRNTPVTYSFPNQRVESRLVKSFRTRAPNSAIPATPLTHRLPRSSALRSHGAFSSTFANESFLDELAHAAGLDPLSCG
jgi:nicotinate dehydrogenase subunit B